VRATCSAAGIQREIGVAVKIGFTTGGYSEHTRSIDIIANGIVAVKVAARITEPFWFGDFSQLFVNLEQTERSLRLTLLIDVLHLTSE